MAKLIYSAITSLDGFIEDERGGFQWAAPDAELFAYINDLERPIGTYLYGRRMYETMVYWETVSDEEQSSESRDFTRLWRAADKLVYSRTLKAASSARTRIEHDFDPAEVGKLKTSATSDLTIGGAQLAATVFAAGLVDELHLFLTPIIIGRGKRALPDTADTHLRLDLRDEHRFQSGVVHLHYALRS